MNSDEKLLLAANCLYAIRCDWSDSKKIKRLANEAFENIPSELFPFEFDEENYIIHCQEDGRHTRDAELNYKDLIDRVIMKNVSKEVKKELEERFEYALIE